MLVVCSPIFVADTKIIFRYDFVARLKEKKSKLVFSILIGGTILKLSPTLGTFLLGEDYFPKNILDQVFLMEIFVVFQRKPNNLNQSISTNS